MRPTEFIDHETIMAGTSIIGPGTSIIGAGTSIVGLCNNSFVPSTSSSSKSSEEQLPPPVSFDVAAYTRILQHMTKLYPFDPAAVAASVSSLGHNSHLPLAFCGSTSLIQPDESRSTDQTLPAEENQISKENIIVKDEIICTNNNNIINNKALDLSTGLKSLYSHYRRIPLSQVKPKLVEDVWVENDYILKWTDSRVAAYNPAQKLFMCVDCECVGFLSRVAEHWLGAHANLRVFHCPRCPYTSAWSRCVKMHLTRQHNEQFADTTMWKENSTLLEVTKLMQDLRTKVETKIDANNTLADKRFYCPHCPYATDRRDLYTRHENIHKDNKPFHCYVCFKQFNRADHVKKHFVRMHPDSEYDISKIRKQQNNPKTNSTADATKNSNTPLTSNVSCPNSVDSVPMEKEPLTVIIDKAEIVSPQPINNEGSQISSSIPDIKQSPSEKIPETVVLDSQSNESQNLNLIQSRVTKPTIEVQSKNRRRGERAFSCHYCHWSGTDNWCLKRHMNTHIKPFACILCDYKAARAERLSTHVWKVHNKRICNKCNFLADTQDRLLEHTREEHHNNPYSRRHICASCGMSFDTRANLETHIHLAHTRPKSPFDIVQITPISDPIKVQINTSDLSLKRSLPGEESLSLICPIEECSKPCESSGVLAEHVRLEHGGLFASRCPHCSYNLTQDELAKDHWLTHHEDVCNACVHVFTSVYGPQLWKKVHVRPQSSSSPLHAIVNGLKKKTEPDSDVTYSTELKSCNELSSSYSIKSTSENQDYEVERLTKRQRKQSCPKKVITISTEEEEEEESFSSNEHEFIISRSFTVKKKFKRIKCLRCPNRPTFSSFSKLRAHRKFKHKKLALIRSRKLSPSNCL